MLAVTQVFDPNARDEFDVEPAGQEIPAEVEAARSQLAEVVDALTPAIDRRIEAHLSAASGALDAMEGVHRFIADRTDLDLETDSRQLAVWLLSGRLTALARAAVALLHAGYGTEVAPTLRVMHETSRVLHAIVDRQEKDLLQRWLDDDNQRHVRPKHARAALGRIRLRTVGTMEELKQKATEAGYGELVAELEEASASVAGDEDDPDYLAHLSLGVYDGLSRVAHARRSGMIDSLSVRGRDFVTGPHPDPRMRGPWVEQTGVTIEEALLAIGDGLDLAFWPGYFTQQILPLIQELAKVRAAHPLDPDEMDRLSQ